MSDPYGAAGRGPYVITAAGRRFWYRESTARLSEVARALSRIRRYNGAMTALWTVGDHVLTGLLFLAEREDPVLNLGWTLHDAHEAYLGDIPGPLKCELGPQFAEYEDDLQQRVMSDLGWEHGPLHEVWQLIHRADRLAVAAEARYFGLCDGWTSGYMTKHALNGEELDRMTQATDHVYRAYPRRDVLEHSRRVSEALLHAVHRCRTALALPYPGRTIETTGGNRDVT